MNTLRLCTAGESHGPAEVCILSGIPSGLSVSPQDINRELARRQRGHGRGGRMAIEADEGVFLAGVRLGKTLGSPICIEVVNRDHANWAGRMSPLAEDSVGAQPVTMPRPGHADLGGLAKFATDDIRDVLERASARETVARVAAGAVCKRLLSEVGVEVRGRVVGIGGVVAETRDMCRFSSVDWAKVEESPVGCDDDQAALAMCEAIDAASEAGESLGGVFEVWCWEPCPGVGGYGTLGERLDGRLMGALGSIPAIKGVEAGVGFTGAATVGSQVHDAIFLGEDQGTKGEAGLVRRTNRSGGIEGGMTTGMPIVVRAAMKPIPTLTTALPSVDLATMTETRAHVERSDVCAVPAARVVGEAMVSLVLASAYLEKFGGDSLQQFKAAVDSYEAGLEERGLWRRSSR